MIGSGWGSLSKMGQSESFPGDFESGTDIKQFSQKALINGLRGGKIKTAVGRNNETDALREEIRIKEKVPMVI